MLGGKVEVGMLRQIAIEDVCCAPITKHLAVHVLRFVPNQLISWLAKGSTGFKTAANLKSERKGKSYRRNAQKLLLIFYHFLRPFTIFWYCVERLKTIRRDRFIPELQVSD